MGQTAHSTPSTTRAAQALANLGPHSSIQSVVSPLMNSICPCPSSAIQWLMAEVSIHTLSVKQLIILNYQIAGDSENALGFVVIYGKVLVSCAMHGTATTNMGQSPWMLTASFFNSSTFIYLFLSHLSLLFSLQSLTNSISYFLSNTFKTLEGFCGVASPMMHPITIFQNHF